MCKQRNLKLLFCWLLLLCFCFGSSAGLFSVNAANVTIGAVGSQSKDFNLYTYNNKKLTVQVQSSIFAAHLYEGFTFNDTNSNNINTEYQDRTYEQQVVMIIRVANNTTQDLCINSGYFSVNQALNITNPAYSATMSIQSAEGTLISGITKVNTDGTIQCRWSTDYTYNSYGVIPSGAVLYAQIIYNYYFSFDGVETAMGTDGAIFSGYPTFTTGSVTPISNFTISAPGYNQEKINEGLNDVNSGIDNQTSVITSEGNQTQNKIQSQTDQQREQYNEFSADSDSSDSSTVNSAITNGTNQIKSNVGLFSFFDNIVTSMSDMFDGNYERSLVLPALDVPLPEETVHVWDSKTFDFDELENNFSVILTVVRFATVAICYIAMIHGALNIFHKFFGIKDGGSGD